MAVDNATLSTADNSDPFVPKYTDGTPIQWDGILRAHIDGALYEIGRYYKRKRTGLFQLQLYSSNIEQSRYPMAGLPWKPSMPFGSPLAE